MAYYEDNKKLAFNTMALYCRTFFVMLVSLFSSRVLLNVLGVEDFGIYNLVGSIVVMFSFLNTAMTQAIQRYITIELGRGVDSQVREVFKVSITSQLLIIIILLAIIEPLGIWFLNNKLEIPIGRISAAQSVFQFSMLTFIVNTLRVPFESTIIANERMAFFAYVSIVDSLLKLLIVLSLMYSSYDNLILYSSLLTAEALLIFLIYIYYCNINYKTYTPFKLSFNKLLLRSMFAFSGWSLLGSTTNVFTQKGFIFLINIYYGVVANAAMGIASQVSGAVSSFINSFQTSFRPQIVKAYAQDDIARLNNLVIKTSKFSFALMFLPTIWLITNMPFILHLWLTDVPQYTVEFCRLILICLIFDATSGPYNCAIMASGNIKNYQVLISSSFMVDIIGSYMLIRFGVPASYILIMRILTRGLFNMIIGLYFLKKQLCFDLNIYFNTVILPILLTLIFVLPNIYILMLLLDSWSLLFASIFLLLSWGLLIILFILFNRDERQYIYKMISTVIKNIKLCTII